MDSFSKSLWEEIEKLKYDVNVDLSKMEVNTAAVSRPSEIFIDEYEHIPLDKRINSCTQVANKIYASWCEQVKLQKFPPVRLRSGWQGPFGEADFSPGKAIPLDNHFVWGYLGPKGIQAIDPWSGKSVQPNINTMNPISRLLLPEDTRTLLDAGFIMSDMTLSCKGKQHLEALLFEKHKAELVALAEKELKEAESDEDED